MTISDLLNTPGGIIFEILMFFVVVAWLVFPFRIIGRLNKIIRLMEDRESKEKYFPTEKK